MVLSNLMRIYLWYSRKTSGDIQRLCMIEQQFLLVGAVLKLLLKGIG